MNMLTEKYQPGNVKLNVVIIGLGRQALEEHLPAVLDSDNYHLIGVCDTNQEMLSNASASLNESVERFTDVATMFASINADVAIVAVPHHEYLPIITECAKNGVHILKEKPFARNMREAKIFQEIAEKANIHLMTTFQRRFHPLYQAFVPMIARIGKIHTITCLYTISSNNPNSGWRGSKKKAGGGVLLDMGYHVLDLLIWYLDRPTILSSTMQICKQNDHDVEDVAQFTFEVNGAHGTGLISCVHPKKHEEFVVIGEKGSAVLTRNRIERYNNNQVLVDYLESEKGWHAAMINQLDYFAMVISGKIKPKYSTPQFQVDNHVVVIDELYSQAEEKPNE